MFNRIKKEFKLLYDSGKHIVYFESIYKLLTIAIAYPFFILFFNWLMKIAGVPYLTNEYVLRMLTTPVAIVSIIVLILLFVWYCSFEMAYLSICFEVKARGLSATIFDIFKYAVNRFIRIMKLRNLWLFFIFMFSVIFVNVAIFLNIFLSEINISLLREYVTSNRELVIICLAVFITIYVIVLLGVYAFNFFMIKQDSMWNCYKKSFRLVKKHFWGTLGGLIGYNLLLGLIMLTVYGIITVMIIAGVKLLDMAYLGSAVYLSVLRNVSIGVRIFSFIMAVPMSYSVITQMFYKYTSSKETDHIQDEQYYDNFTWIKKSPVKRIKYIYKILLVIAIFVDLAYVVMSFNKNPFSRVAIFNTTAITAHRGASVAAPENTMAAFRDAIENMADYVELDVQRTLDGKLVIMHDDSARRTTGVDKNISEMTIEEVSKLNAGSWYGTQFQEEKVPTLEQVLELCASRHVAVNIDMKPSEYTEEVCKMVISLMKKYHLIDNSVISSSDLDLLRCVKEIEPDVKVGYVVAVAYGNFYDIDIVDFYSMSAVYLNKQTIDKIHRAGKQVHAWTVNNRIDVKNLTNKGVDNIITDNPIMAREVIYSMNTSENIVSMIHYVLNF